MVTRDLCAGVVDFAYSWSHYERFEIEASVSLIQVVTKGRLLSRYQVWCLAVVYERHYEAELSLLLRVIDDYCDYLKSILPRNGAILRLDYEFSTECIESKHGAVEQTLCSVIIHNS